MAPRPKYKLLPCPFCGSQKIVIQSCPSGGFDFFYALCSKCMAEGPEGETKEKAIQKWNFRTEVQEYKAEIDRLQDWIKWAGERAEGENIAFILHEVVTPALEGKLLRITPSEVKYEDR